MATISKFYLLDAATPNTGTMPTSSPSSHTSGPLGGGTEAAGAATARDATAVAGSAQQTATITDAAAATHQILGFRRFVSRPLAAHTFAAADGNWTFSCAVLESNTNHAGFAAVDIYPWRPSTGLQVGAAILLTLSVSETGTTQTAQSVTGTSTANSIVDGDILVFDVYDNANQTMATAYTASFFYNGTTEASTTTCASFVTPPSALTLFTGAAAVIPDVYTARTLT